MLHSWLVAAVCNCYCKLCKDGLDNKILYLISLTRSGKFGSHSLALKWMSLGSMSALRGCKHDRPDVGRTQLVYWLGVNETTCFGLLGGHHQVYNVGSKRQIIMWVADVEISSSCFTKYIWEKTVCRRVMNFISAPSYTHFVSYIQGYSKWLWGVNNLSYTIHLVLQMQPHVISFYGFTSRIRFMFLLFPQISRNWRLLHATNSLERTRLSCWCL